MSSVSSLSRLRGEGGIGGIWVIASSALGVGVGLLGLPLLTIGLFMSSLHQAFGWSRAEVAGASTCINLATIIAAPFAGRLCDKFGVRPVALASLCSLTVGFACLAGMNGSLLVYYVTWFLLAAGGVGTSGIVWTRAVGTYFHKNRGLALGLALTGTAFAALIAPLTLGPVIADFGWRAGFAALGAVSLLTIPVTWFLFSERREGHDAHALQSGVTLGEAVRSGSYWRLGLGIFLLVAGMGSAMVHLVPLAIDSGLPPATAQRLFAIVGLSMLLGRVSIGTLLDRLDPLRVAAVSLAIPAAGCVLLLAGAPSVAVFACAIALFGFSAGAEVDILAYIVARYFGLKAYGAIYGSQLMFFSAGSGLGSLLTGYVRDHTGTYGPALIAGVAVFIAGAMLVASIGATLGTKSKRHAHSAAPGRVDGLV
jgi:predicted MFS family arabinose efflux permease